MASTVQLSGSKLESEINPDEYVMMHKAELRVALSDSNSLKWASKTCEFLGPLFIGIGVTSLFAEKIPYEIFTNGRMWIIFGFCFTGLGFYFQKQKEDIITSIIKEKLNEAT